MLLAHARPKLRCLLTAAAVMLAAPAIAQTFAPGAGGLTPPDIKSDAALSAALAVLDRSADTIVAEVGPHTITWGDIADAIRDARGLKIDRRKIHLDDPIRNIGTYMVVVEIADGVTAAVKTMIVAASS